MDAAIVEVTAIDPAALELDAVDLATMELISSVKQLVPMEERTKDRGRVLLLVVDEL